jgi:hypothetical protein
MQQWGGNEGGFFFLGNAAHCNPLKYLRLQTKRGWDENIASSLFYLYPYSLAYTVLHAVNNTGLTRLSMPFFYEPHCEANVNSCLPAALRGKHCTDW